MQSILNPFEIKIRKKSKISYPITYEAFFPPFFQFSSRMGSKKITCERQRIQYAVSSHVIFYCFLNLFSGICSVNILITFHIPSLHHKNQRWQNNLLGFPPAESSGLFRLLSATTLRISVCHYSCIP